MKSFNININDLCDSLNGHRGLNKPVGFGKNAQGSFVVGFIATDRESGLPVWTKDGQRVKINLRLSRDRVE